MFEAKEGEESKEEKQVLWKKCFSSKSNAYTCAGVEGWQGEKCLHQDRGREGLFVCLLFAHSRIKKSERNQMKIIWMKDRERKTGEENERNVCRSQRPWF